MNANNATTATEKNRPGRPTGFRLKFTLPAGKIREGIESGQLPGEIRMTIVNERPRSQEEILAIIMASPGKVTDAAFMADIVTEKLTGGKTIKEVIEGMENETLVEMARVDVYNHMDRMKEKAMAFCQANDKREE